MSPEEFARYKANNEGRREGHLERIHTDDFAGAAEGREGNSNIDDEDDAKPPANNAKWRCKNAIMIMSFKLRFARCARWICSMIQDQLLIMLMQIMIPTTAERR